MWTVDDAIADAEEVLPGEPAPDGEVDTRWQLIIRVAEFAATDPEPLWAFARRWGSSPDPDLRQGISSCLLEHLLQFHFTLIFPRVAALARTDPLFAGTFLGCWEFGQTEEPANRAQFNALKAELQARAR